MLLKSEFMKLEKRCQNWETRPTSVYCHPQLGHHACLCSVGHWASGRLLGGTWHAAAATTCSTNTTVVLGYWRGSRCWTWAGVLQPGACTPRHAAQLHDDHDSQQRQDIWDEEWFIFWLESPGDVCGLFCCWRPSWSPWLLLPLETMLLIWAAAYANQVDVHDSFSDRKPCESPWSMLLLTAGCYKQGSLFCNNIDDFRFITENERHKASVLTPPLKKQTMLPPKKQSRWKAIKRVLGLERWLRG